MVEATLPKEKLGLLLKVGLFVFLAIVGVYVFATVFWFSGYLATAAISTFAAAGVANAVTMRVFERRSMADLGLAWTRGSARNLGLGLAGGAASALLVLGLPLLAGLAELVPDRENPGGVPSLIYVSAILMFGAVGEELLLRGYGFQVLVANLGRFATILPVSVVFGLLHLGNPNASNLGFLNTVGFGIAFGYAFTRSGDLWLPIGLHFGWNWVLPLFGVPLSGLTMGVTGFTMRFHVSELWSGGGYGPEASLLTCFVLVALFLFIWKAPVQPQSPYLLRAKTEEEANA